MDRPQRFRPTNRDGTPVDPVPFLVAALTGVATVVSFGPAYLVEVGLSPGAALGTCGVLVVGTTVVAYHRYVRTAPADPGAGVPAGVRLERLFYGVLVGIALLALLSIPLLVR